MFETALNKPTWDFEKHRACCAVCGDEAVFSVQINLSREGVHKGQVLTAFCQRCDDALSKLINGFFENALEKGRKGEENGERGD